METGVVRACADTSLLGLGADARVGLFTNFTGTMPDLTRNIEALLGAGVPLVGIFTPEHGLWGSAPAGESEPSGTDEASGLPVDDTYRIHGDALDELLSARRPTHILVDFQDVGVRFYTYLWTLYDVMESAGRLGLPVVVLDRPNPIAGYGPQGPGLADGISSFVGRRGIPIMTGSTIGEMALHFRRCFLPDVDVRVVELTGWDRASALGTWTGPWVPPSPAMASPTTATAYPGTCFFEGTNTSEGRGTCQPFLQFGAPWGDGHLREDLAALDLPGVVFRDAMFIPTTSKFTGEACRGVQLHITDAAAYQPLPTGIAVLQAIARRYPDFAVLPPYSEGRPRMMDLLWGCDVLRTRLTEADFDDMLAASPAATDPREDWIYG